MHWSKGELLQHILELNNSNQLFKLKYKLETQPFCGVQQCYDLERFVFHMLTIEQRELVLTHMNKISQEVEPRIHIFTSYDYHGHTRIYMGNTSTPDLIFNIKNTNGETLNLEYISPEDIFSGRIPFVSYSVNSLKKIYNKQGGGKKIKLYKFLELNF